MAIDAINITGNPDTNVDWYADGERANALVLNRPIKEVAGFINQIITQVNGLPSSTQGILDALKLIDGDGSGLDADLLDGLDSTAFALSGHTHTGTYQPAGTYNTIIGTDTDINTSGAFIIDNIYVTDGVITSMGTRELTAADIGAATADANILKANLTDNLEVGYTTNVFNLGSAVTYTVNFSLPGLVTWQPGVNFTIYEPSSSTYGCQQILITPTGSVTVSTGTDVSLTTSSPDTLVADTSYIATISRFSSTKTVVNIQEVL